MVKAYKKTGYDLDEMLANLPMKDESIINIQYIQTLVKEEEDIEVEEGEEKISYSIVLYKLTVFYRC